MGGRECKTCQESVLSSKLIDTTSTDAILICRCSTLPMRGERDRTGSEYNKIGRHSPSFVRVRDGQGNAGFQKCAIIQMAVRAFSIISITFN